jgi:hypothetical protein
MMEQPELVKYRINGVEVSALVAGNSERPALLLIHTKATDNISKHDDELGSPRSCLHYR